MPLQTPGPARLRPIAMVRCPEELEEGMYRKSPIKFGKSGAIPTLKLKYHTIKINTIFILGFMQRQTLSTFSSNYVCINRTYMPSLCIYMYCSTKCHINPQCPQPQNNQIYKILCL